MVRNYQSLPCGIGDDYDDDDSQYGASDMEDDYDSFESQVSSSISGDTEDPRDSRRRNVDRNNSEQRNDNGRRESWSPFRTKNKHGRETSQRESGMNQVDRRIIHSTSTSDSSDNNEQRGSDPRVSFIKRFSRSSTKYEESVSVVSETTSGAGSEFTDSVSLDDESYVWQ